MSYATDGEAADGQMHELARLLHGSGPPPLPGSWRIEKAPTTSSPTGHAIRDSCRFRSRTRGEAAIPAPGSWRMSAASRGHFAFDSCSR